MSLINDALKRAKQAQDQTPPPAPSPELHLRPVENPPYVRHGLGIAIPIALAIVALLVLFLVWRWARQDGSAPQKVRAKTLTAQEPVIPSQPAPPIDVSTPPPAVNPERRVETSKPDKEAGVPPSSAQSKPAAEPTLTQTANDNPSTQAHPAAAEEAEIAKPAPLKLQGIVFSSTRPSAVVSGKPLFIGDRIRDLKVVAIARDSITLVGKGQTNVLSFSE